MRTRYQHGSFHTAPASKEVVNDKKKLIDKVTKLFALADSTTHSAEAEAARKMAVDLLAKHNMTLSSISVDELEYHEVVECFPGNMPNHTKILHNGIADFTGVLMVLGHKTFHYIGTRSNIEAFRYMLNVVIEQRDRGLAKWKREAPEYKLKTSTPQKWQLGFAYGVMDKCKSLKKQTQERVNEKGMIVLDEMQLAQTWYTKDHPLEETKIKSTYNQSGFSAGQNANLNKGVTKQASHKMIGV